MKKRVKAKPTAPAERARLFLEKGNGQVEKFAKDFGIGRPALLAWLKLHPDSERRALHADVKSKIFTRSATGLPEAAPEEKLVEQVVAKADGANVIAIENHARRNRIGLTISNLEISSEDGFTTLVVYGKEMSLVLAVADLALVSVHKIHNDKVRGVLAEAWS